MMALFALSSPMVIYVAQAQLACKHGLLSWVSTDSQLKLVRGLCVEAARASIGVPVHRVGNLCKTFFETFHVNFFFAGTLPRGKMCRFA
jgi:hypothetical protein